ncbi:MAG: allophanate hydrolase [Thiobacillus sp.]
MNLTQTSLDFHSLGEAYKQRATTPVAVIREIYRRIRSRGQDYVWTHFAAEEAVIAQAEALMTRDPKTLPLYGLPFCVKDNIHVVGMPTTASCPAYSHYPDATATVVEKLISAGALLIGKNTMDQFATGLVGIRSPGHPVNPFNPEYIPGGSSSGSAVAVSAGLVSFALGSDTGGSGRVPAGLNNVVGLKPTPGLISTAGMVYANRSFDCVPVFALTCADAQTVFDVAIGADAKDPCLRRDPLHVARASIPENDFIVGIPDRNNRKFFGDQQAEHCFNRALDTIEKLGGTIREIDFTPFAEVSPMLFSGPILAERYASVGKFIENHRDEVHPVVASIIEKAKTYTAVDLVQEYYRLLALKAAAYNQLEKIDALMVPTAGTIYKIKQVEDDPVATNANMGYYTYFANLLQLAVLAVPAGFREDGLPFGVCFIAGPQEDRALVSLGTRFHDAANEVLGATNMRMTGRA